MIKPKLVLVGSIGMLGLIVVGSMFVKQRYYDPMRRLDSARDEVHSLVASNSIRDGDVIFQTSLSSQSKAIQLATHSAYSHCGIIFKGGKDMYVLEAVMPVRKTPLDEWLARGRDGKYWLMRLKNADRVLTSSTLKSMRGIGDSFLGKQYDLSFEWSDDKMYCSELIWKIYFRGAGLSIGNLERLRDFDLTHDAVLKKLKERYGNNIPREEIVISPAAIANCSLLKMVATNE